MDYSALRKRSNSPSDPGKMIKSFNYLSVLLLISCQCPELWMLCHSEQYQSLFSMHLETISPLETQNSLLHYWWLYQGGHTLSRRSPQWLPLDSDLEHLWLQGKPTNWNLSVYSYKEKHTLEVGLTNKICVLCHVSCNILPRFHRSHQSTWSLVFSLGGRGARGG